MCFCSKALALGYRHIDSAAAYGNEQAVGEGLKTFVGQRADLFISRCGVSQIPNSFMMKPIMNNQELHRFCFWGNEADWKRQQRHIS